MLKKYASYVIGLLMLLLLVTACSTDETTNDPSQENDNNETKTADAAEELKLPETDLQKMDEGTAVQALQEVLNEIGYSITSNGNFDDTTTWAVTDFQLQQEDLLALGVYNAETKEALEELLSTGDTVEAEAGLPLDAEEASTSHEDTHVLANPYDQLALVNKQYALPSDYTPDDLVVPDVPFPFDEDLPQKQLRAVAADALEELFQAADEAGLDLVAQSGYRSYDRQDTIFASNVEAHGEEAANNFSAQPGESEHQTGLTMDVTTPHINNELTIEFGETAEGKWVEEHAAEYGFIIRYPEGKEEITEYQFEPWHIRYVGEKTAQEITAQAITLEEYYGVE
ncbi:D-alanyl-D-alanine carboxypeptidase [Virgibacillus natechei]|uniref:D-alanyl-D-alanine carboxypeptidase n=1 Tax=Virgibacillus natechei TaxID=1216297 RepID=A0ABS4IDT3_9BACI|nr:D-alanyl-D-alanine carboxypeptidase family protein [Virgibacillus natechei]MBP1968496.1 D-alanyl-D-alanine carboxypeptidase [Virgibacillus natechei]UZD13614.1 D-alanyl-D-alanine carboxypeptidase family protein [Virgibacillus natechei]